MKNNKFKFGRDKPKKSIVVAKALPDIDKDHPFYSKEADKERKALLKKLEKEEKELAEENRRRYRNRNKKETNEEEKPNIDLEEQSPTALEPSDKAEGGQRVRGVRGKVISKRPSHRRKRVSAPTP